MSKFIQLGMCKKKLLLPFGVAFMQILINIMNLTLPEKPKNQIFEMLGVAFSEISVGLIPLFHIYKFKPTNTSIIKRRKKTMFIILHFFVLFLIFSIYVILNIFKVAVANNLYDGDKSRQNPHNTGLSSFESLELFLISLVSVLILNYKYFIHHNISIVIFIIISSIIDLILGKFPEFFEKGILFISLNISIVVLDAIDY